jgi:hypothetical protein
VVVTLIVLELIEVELSEFMEAGIMSGLDIETNDDGVTPKLRITVFVDGSRRSESSSVCRARDKLVGLSLRRTTAPCATRRSSDAGNVREPHNHGRQFKGHRVLSP